MLMLSSPQLIFNYTTMYPYAGGVSSAYVISTNTTDIDIVATPWPSQTGQNLVTIVAQPSVFSTVYYRTFHKFVVTVSGSEQSIAFVNGATQVPSGAFWDLEVTQIPTFAPEIASHVEVTHIRDSRVKRKTAPVCKKEAYLDDYDSLEDTSSGSEDSDEEFGAVTTTPTTQVDDYRPLVGLPTGIPLNNRLEQLKRKQEKSTATPRA